MTAHEIDYHIYGEEMQYVEIELDPQEAVVAEAGSFMMMDNGISMDTIFGDGSNQEKGVLGKLFSAGKRLLTGESLFMTVFLNAETGKKKVSFASPYPGKIVPIDLTNYGGKFVCQKDAFLCAAKGVSVGIEFSKRLGRGFFGGEGFIMQKLEGDGMAFVHAGGTMARKELAPGEVLKVDTGCIVGFTKDVDYNIEFVGGIKNTVFGGEGLFFATLRGPGVVYVQSLPFSRLASRVWAAAPQGGGKDKGEGSVLGGLGDIISGDNRF
ncbi:TIGR00266 family protein [Sinomicrobium sp. M5D2P17]